MGIGTQSGSRRDNAFECPQTGTYKSSSRDGIYQYREDRICPAPVAERAGVEAVFAEVSLRFLCKEMTRLVIQIDDWDVLRPSDLFDGGSYLLTAQVCERS